MIRLKFLSDFNELFLLKSEKMNFPDLTILNTLIIFIILPKRRIPIMGIDETKSIQLDLINLALCSDRNNPVKKSARNKLQMMVSIINRVCLVCSE